MSENKAARIIKEHYIQAPISMIETEHETRSGRASRLACAFEVKVIIWVDQHLPEYRYAIPESLLNRKENLEHWDEIYPIEMRFVTYKPTGKVVYDNTKPHAEAIVYEYILESMVGKKDLVHR